MKDEEKIINRKPIWKLPKFVIVAALCLITVIVVVTVILSAGSKDDDIAQKLETAKKYLTEMKYEEAKALFEEIIEADPKCEDAYIGLADAYIGLGDEDKAIEVLKEGIDNVEEIFNLNEKLKEIEGKKKDEDKNKETDTTKNVTMDTSTKLEVNVTTENNKNTYEQDTYIEGGIITEADTTTKEQATTKIQQQTMTRNQQTTVPNVVGKTEDEAIDALQKNSLGFKVESREHSNQYEKGHVIRQSKPAGEVIDKNSTILIVVSAGPEKMTTLENIEQTTEKKQETAKYRVYNINMTWEEAKKYCEELGGHLAVITSQNEQDQIYELLKDEKLEAYWLGAYVQNGVWNWVTDEKFEYENWYENEPNGGGDYMYMQIFTAKYTNACNGYWDDTWNEGDRGGGVKVHGFICEYEN